MRGIWLAFVGALALPFTAGAFSYSEGVSGDLSGDRLAPTALVAAAGSNTLSGSTIGGDLDYVRISLPGGLQLASLVLDSVTSTDDVAFIAVQEGTTFTVTPAGASASDLLGYAHFGTGPIAGGATVGSDMLDDMGVAPGAIGFVPPLGATDYTFWIQQIGAAPFGYSLNFVAVPEPGTLALLGPALLALAAMRSRAPRRWFRTLAQTPRATVPPGGMRCTRSPSAAIS